ncbi:MAG: carbonic anhydrase family protein [Caldilineaceae bacterium]
MHYLRLYLTGILLSMAVLTACHPLVAAVPQHGITEQGAATHGAESNAHQDHAIHWSYEGEGGPDHWGELNADYTACADGASQSPIDLSNAVGEDLPDIAFHYGESALNILNNGHTVQVNYDEGSYIEVDGMRYDLLQFHFHAPSEHTINGEQYPLELHLVHRNAEGGLAVVGVMIQEGAENPAFADIIAHAPAGEMAVMTVDNLMVSAESLLPAERLYFAYSGSLTTPPCSEQVKWHVLTTPVELSVEQIATLANILHNNFRPVQPLHDRTLVVDTTSDR